MGGGRRKEASGKEGKREGIGGEGEKERRGVKERGRVGMRRQKMTVGKNIGIEETSLSECKCY